MKRKVLSLFLALALVLSMIPAMSVTAFADEPSGEKIVTFDFTSGTAAMDYPITSGEGTARSIVTNAQDGIVNLTVNTAGYETSVLNLDLGYLFIPNGNNAITISCKKGYTITKVEYQIHAIFPIGSFGFQTAYNTFSGVGPCSDPYTLAVIGDSTAKLTDITNTGLESYEAPKGAVVTEVKLSNDAPSNTYLDSIKVTVKELPQMNVKYFAFGNTITAKYFDADKKLGVVSFKCSR